MNAQISPRSEPLALVGSFLARTHGLFIDGKFVPAQSGETFDVINPATGEVFAKAATGGAADIDLAVWEGRAPRLRQRAVVHHEPVGPPQSHVEAVRCDREARGGIRDSRESRQRHADHHGALHGGRCFGVFALQRRLGGQDYGRDAHHRGAQPIMSTRCASLSVWWVRSLRGTCRSPWK